ncbi:TPA: FISUMP domain-containing protein [Elizabethkingia anophelis]
MKKERFLIRNTIGLAIALIAVSCRSTDTENALNGNGISAVSFNLLGTEYADSGKLSGQASLERGSIINPANEIQRHSILVTPSNVITAELSPSSETPKVLANASSGINSTAAISGNPLAPGIKFRVIAYRSNGAYHTHQDYTVGQPAIPMMLDNGAAYTIIVYSYGVSSLPDISSDEQSTAANALNIASVNYNNTNRDFMYQKIPFVPVNANNILSITLRHKVAQITTIVNSAGLGNITNITGGVLTPHYSNGVIPLSSGVMTGRTTITGGVPLSFSGLNTTTSTAAPVFVNTDTRGNATGGFSANITIAGITKTISLPNSFKVTPENKSNLTINLSICGAYVGPSTNPANYKEFMCHNLGADTAADPLVASAAVHGAKYKWGANTNEIGSYYSQKDDQANSDDIPGWNTVPPKPDGSWSDNSNINNPCPSGYRVPTGDQWQAVTRNNKVERVGSWVDNGNYTSALYVINPSNVRTLMFPAAGFRRSSGSMGGRGYYGYYWSSTGVSSDKATRMHFHNITWYTADMPRTEAYSVRCIAE